MDDSLQQNIDEQPLHTELSKENKIEYSLEPVEWHKQEHTLGAAKDKGEKVELSEEIEVDGVDTINAIPLSSEHSPLDADISFHPEYAPPIVEASAESKEVFTLNETGNTLTPTNPDFSAHGKPVILNEIHLLNLKKGGIVNLPFDINRTMLVEKVERRKNGSTKLSLSFPGESDVYRGFITIGAKATYGRIVTPEGSFELEAVNGNGWIIDTRDIDDKMPENGIDYVVPDI
ncbi:MAG: hypothetical protein COB33_007850 [Thiotrichaceae bacterium]|nr:hypothetical protein [Thiotrichaceae bacterium]